MSAVQEKVHATLGASSASRWMSCPGSVRLSESCPPTPNSIHAQTGTAAHALAELSLRKGNSPDLYVGTSLEGIEVTEEMAAHVSVFVDYCRSLHGTVSFIEHQFTLAKLNPPGPMFGTADFVVVDTKGRVLEVVDFKYGQGVVVDVNENKQLRYYALGTLLTLSLNDYDCVDTVKITIVQPRAEHIDGVIRTEVMDVAELIGFTNELLDAARATLDPNAAIIPGSHCRWCPASGVCPAQRDRAALVAQSDFADLPTHTPPASALVPIEDLAAWATKFHVLEDWMSAVRARLQQTLEQGGQVPGYKLVARRANRSWVDEQVAAQQFRSLGWLDEDILVSKLKSPAQIEKLVGKKNLPAELTQKVSSGNTMVPVSDARDAVEIHPGSEFAVLTAGPNEETS